MLSDSESSALALRAKETRHDGDTTTPADDRPAARLPASPAGSPGNVFNRAVVAPDPAGHQRLGLPRAAGARPQERRVAHDPVNLLDHDGQRYLVAPRGTTQWVRNLRAAGQRRAAGRAPGRGVPRHRDRRRRQGRRSCGRTCGAGRWRSACSSTASAPTRPTRSCARSPTATRCSASSPSPRRAGDGVDRLREQARHAREFGGSSRRHGAGIWLIPAAPRRSVAHRAAEAGKTSCVESGPGTRLRRAGAEQATRRPGATIAELRGLVLGARQPPTRPDAVAGRPDRCRSKYPTRRSTRERRSARCSSGAASSPKTNSAKR